MSHLQFIKDEMTFIEKLLNSYVFEPKTPNLFEKLVLYKEDLQQSKKEQERLTKLIIRQERNLGGIFECTQKICDEAFYERHHKLQDRVLQYFDDYLKLKTELYQYAGSVLKKRKP
ncbi:MULTISPECIES: hypothetical protein [Flavobacteriaceae]|uniref:hypothetical protein n=1 Tax=Flavobacteriaceae TaxID=49546 RepID=UPI001490F045|nr:MULTISPECIES: hypothetical protein [Allomuricauda]MDC6365945.1 hypothetical protein [Muricauda sp. AC10]